MIERYFFCMVCQKEFFKYNQGKVCCTCGIFIRNNRVFQRLNYLKESLNDIINNLYYYNKKHNLKFSKFEIYQIYDISKEIHSIRTFFKI